MFVNVCCWLLDAWFWSFVVYLSLLVVLFVVGRVFCAGLLCIGRLLTVARVACWLVFVGHCSLSVVCYVLRLACCSWCVWLVLLRCVLFDDVC